MTIYLYPVHVTSNKCWKCSNKLWVLRCRTQSNWSQYLPKIMRMMHKSFKYICMYSSDILWKRPSVEVKLFFRLLLKRQTLEEILIEQLNLYQHTSRIWNSKWHTFPKWNHEFFGEMMDLVPTMYIAVSSE